MQIYFESLTRERGIGMEGLIITSSGVNGGLAHVTGTFEGKSFEMHYNAEEATGTIDGDFSDMERMQILTGWEMVK